MQPTLLLEYFDPADFFEDIGDGKASNLAHEHSEHPPAGFLSVHFVSVSGIGLVIETIVFKDDKATKVGNYVVGVSPDPDKLLDA